MGRNDELVTNVGGVTSLCEQIEHFTLPLCQAILLRYSIASIYIVLPTIHDAGNVLSRENLPIGFLLKHFIFLAWIVAPGGKQREDDDQKNNDDDYPYLTSHLSK